MRIENAQPPLLCIHEACGARLSMQALQSKFLLGLAGSSKAALTHCCAYADCVLKET